MSHEERVTDSVAERFALPMGKFTDDFIAACDQYWKAMSLHMGSSVLFLKNKEKECKPGSTCARLAEILDPCVMFSRYRVSNQTFRESLHRGIVETEFEIKRHIDIDFLILHPTLGVVVFNYLSVQYGHNVASGVDNKHESMVVFLKWLHEITQENMPIYIWRHSKLEVGERTDIDWGCHVPTIQTSDESLEETARAEVKSRSTGNTYDYSSLAKCLLGLRCDKIGIPRTNNLSKVRNSERKPSAELSGLFDSREKFVSAAKRYTLKMCPLWKHHNHSRCYMLPPIFKITNTSQYATTGGENATTDTLSVADVGQFCEAIVYDEIEKAGRSRWPNAKAIIISNLKLAMGHLRNLQDLADPSIRADLGWTRHEFNEKETVFEADFIILTPSKVAVLEVKGCTVESATREVIRKAKAQTLVCEAFLEYLCRVFNLNWGGCTKVVVFPKVSNKEFQDKLGENYLSSINPDIIYVFMDTFNELFYGHDIFKREYGEDGNKDVYNGLCPVLVLLRGMQADGQVMDISYARAIYTTASQVDQHRVNASKGYNALHGTGYYRDKNRSKMKSMRQKATTVFRRNRSARQANDKGLTHSSAISTKSGAIISSEHAHSIEQTVLDVYFLTAEQMEVWNCKNSCILIRGIAGSGKTILLMAKAKELIENKQRFSIFSSRPFDSIYRRFLSTTTGYCESEVFCHTDVAYLFPMVTRLVTSFRRELQESVGKPEAVRKTISKILSSVEIQKELRGWEDVSFLVDDAQTLAWPVTVPWTHALNEDNHAIALLMVVLSPRWKNATQIHRSDFPIFWVACDGLLQNEPWELELLGTFLGRQNLSASLRNPSNIPALGQEEVTIRSSRTARDGEIDSGNRIETETLYRVKSGHQLRGIWRKIYIGAGSMSYQRLTAEAIQIELVDMGLQALGDKPLDHNGYMSMSDAVIMTQDFSCDCLPVELKQLGITTGSIEEFAAGKDVLTLASYKACHSFEWPIVFIVRSEFGVGRESAWTTERLYVLRSRCTACLIEVILDKSVTMDIFGCEHRRNDDKTVSVRGQAI